MDQIVRVGPNCLISRLGKGCSWGTRVCVYGPRRQLMPGSPVAAFDLQEPWIRTIFGFVGITDISYIHGPQGMTMGRPGAWLVGTCGGSSSRRWSRAGVRSLNKYESSWDVAIIGGGPAGLMAAHSGGRAGT